MKTTRFALALCVFGAASLALFACANSSPEPSVSPAPSASASAATPGGTGWEGAPWARFHSIRHDAWLTLPDGPHWKIDDHRAQWLVAQHASTSSTLSARLFRENEPVNRQKCEAAARAASPPTLPIDDPKTRVDSRQDDVIPGWDGYEFAIVTPRKSEQGGMVIQGELVAIAAKIHQCFALHYVTTQSGPGAETTIALRLADMSEVVRRITFENDREGPSRAPLPSTH